MFAMSCNNKPSVNYSENKYTLLVKHVANPRFKHYQEKVTEFDSHDPKCLWASNPHDMKAETCPAYRLTTLIRTF